MPVYKVGDMVNPMYVSNHFFPITDVVKGKSSYLYFVSGFSTPFYEDELRGVDDDE